MDLNYGAKFQKIAENLQPIKQLRDKRLKKKFFREYILAIYQF